MNKLVKKGLSLLVAVMFAASPVLAADFDSNQPVRINDGTDDFGVTTAKPLTVQLSDGGELATITSGALDVNIASGGVAPSAVDDSAFTIATDNVSPAGYLADETTPDSVDEGDVGLARMTLDRKVLVRVVGATDGNRLDVDASGNANVILASNSGVDIGDVDVLSVPAPLNVVGGGTEAAALRVTIANDSTGLVSIDDGGGSLTVDAVQLDIDDLASGTDSVSVLQATHDSLNANANLQVADTDVSSSNPVPVDEVEPVVSSNEVHDYNTASAIASAATSNHDFTVTGTTFFLESISVTASRGIKAELQTGPIASLTTDLVIFTSPSNPTFTRRFNPPIEVPVTATGTVRIIRTNRALVTQDLYSTIEGYDI